MSGCDFKPARSSLHSVAPSGPDRKAAEYVVTGAAVADGLLYAADFSGFLHALEEQQAKAREIGREVKKLQAAADAGTIAGSKVLDVQVDDEAGPAKP